LPFPPLTKGGDQARFGITFLENFLTARAV
jgi:hypothetical protein